MIEYMEYVLAIQWGWQEWVLILALALLIFGGRKLPELARSLGRSLNEFKKGVREVEDVKDDVTKDVKQAGDEVAKEIKQAAESQEDNNKS